MPEALGGRTDAELDHAWREAGAALGRTLRLKVLAPDLGESRSPVRTPPTDFTSGLPLTMSVGDAARAIGVSRGNRLRDDPEGGHSGGPFGAPDPYPPAVHRCSPGWPEYPNVRG
jgi:hypothetical protein